MNLAFKPDLSKIEALRASRPPIEVEVDDKPSVYRKWTSVEVSIIQELLILGVSHKAMAQMMGCGVGALKSVIANYKLNRATKAKRKELLQSVFDKYEYEMK